MKHDQLPAAKYVQVQQRSYFGATLPGLQPIDPRQDGPGDMIPMAGEHFGPYEILGTLGRGGVGEVYRAWDGRLEREVALKVLHDEYPQQGNRERFMIEARAASALNHANICTVFDIGQKDGAPYLVMELLKGETLKQRIERGGIASEEIAQFGMEIAEALNAAHSLGIVHRDIKPANVMLVRQPDGRSRVKVLDFGLAKLTEPLPGRLTRHHEHLTVFGEAVGTVSYMSPEQARGEELDGRSDLFSLGVLMYEMATRRTPFRGSTTALLFVQLLNHAPEPIQNWNESVPRALDKIIFRLLEKDPSRRFQSAADLAAALPGLAARASGTRWRKSSPAVPLVRVEEPVARASLPPRPDFLHEQGAVSLGIKSTSHNPAARIASEPAIDRSRPSAPLPEIDRPQSRQGSAARHISTRIILHDSAGYPARTSGSHGLFLETPVGSLPIAVDEPQAMWGTPPAFSGGSILRIAASAFKETQTTRKRIMLPGAIAATCLVAVAAVFAATQLSHRSAALLSQSDSILVTEIENHTGVQTLDGSVAAGFDFALAQAPELNIRGVAAYRGAVHTMGADARPASAMQARQAAHAAGARAYLYGEVREGDDGAHSTGAGYTLAAAVIEASTSRELAHAEARAARTQEIPGAIDEVVASLRTQLLGRQPPKPGTLADSSIASVPLAREASGSLNALRAYAAGARAQAENRPEAALKAYGTAAATDPNFVQALLQISWLARRQGGDASSAQTATRAQAAVSFRSSRTVQLAEIAAAANATGDLIKAETTARHLSAARPHDAEANLELARILRLQGRFSEALTAAQQGLTAGAQDPDLYREAELSLLGLDRYDEALGMEDKASSLGLAHPSLALASAYLAGKHDRLLDATKAFDTAADAEALAARATYLDNTGQLSEGITAWREASDSTRGQPSLTGAGAVFVAHAALDRALAGDCPAAIALGRNAANSLATTSNSQFNAGIAGALCADTSLAHAAAASRSGPHAPVQTPLLRAATALAQGNADTALAELNSIHQYDPSLLATYLGGLAHLANHDSASAVTEFQSILAHRGAALTGGTSIYPAAQLALARALAVQGDDAASQKALVGFNQLWNSATPADRLRAQNSLANHRGAPLQEPLSASLDTTPTLIRTSTEPQRPHVRQLQATPMRTQTIPQEKTALAAWPDRPARLPSYPQERKYQNIRESDLE
ncbi:MAG: hypothetical protein NVSMB62_01320 [Acidobacteriaceae bacterium]